MSMEPNDRPIDSSLVPPRFAPTDVELTEYVAGRASPEVEVAIDRWARSDIAHAHEIVRLRAAWAQLSEIPHALRDIDARTAWTRVAPSTQPSTHRTLLRTHGSTHRGWVPAIRRIGAWGLGLVIVACAAVVGWEHAMSGVLHDNGMTYITRVGQRATLRLQGGTNVVLAPMTTLRVTHESRRGTTMTVAHLEGEAYFTVNPNRRAPLVVRTGMATTRVIGTTFDVRRYQNESFTRVDVTSGKVVLRAEMDGITQSAVLHAGMTGISSDSGAIHLTESDTAISAWTAGHLVFRRVPLADVLQDVGRWYGIRFQLADPAMVRRHVTASLDFGSRAELLRALQFILDVSVTVESPSDSVTPLVTLHPHSTIPPAIPRWDGVHQLPTNREIGR